MSEAIQSPEATPIYLTEPIFRISVERYHAMIANGTLTEDDPVELIEGALVFKMPKNKPHVIAVRRLMTIAVKSVSDAWSVRIQDPITLTDSEPEPDLVIASKIAEEAAEAHPLAADVALVVEVADSTLAFDRGRKLRLYARSGIKTYWIVNLQDRVIEIYDAGDRTPAEDAFGTPTIVDLAGSVTLPQRIGGATILAKDILP